MNSLQSIRNHQKKEGGAVTKIFYFLRLSFLGLVFLIIGLTSSGYALGSMKVVYTISNDWGNAQPAKWFWGGLADWSSASGIKFYIKTDGTSGVTYTVYIDQDNDGDNATDDAWYKDLSISGTGWQEITIPWSDFQDPSWDTDIDSSLDGQNILAIVFMVQAPSGTPISGTYWVDECSLVGGNGLYNWDSDDEGFVGGGYHGTCTISQDTTVYTQDSGSGDTTAPSQPELVSPANSASFNNQTLFHFIWKHSTDDTEVTGYTIDVAADSGFANVEVSKSTSDTNINLVLTNGTKYWRVKARDAALNESTYETRNFAVNNTSTNGSLAVNYTITNNYGNFGAQKLYASAQNWSSYSGVKFYVQSDGTPGINYYVYIYEDNDLNNAYDDVWTYKITNIGAGWKSVTLPWGSFSDPTWDSDIDSSLDANNVLGIGFFAEAPSGAPVDGVFRIDEFSRLDGSTPEVFFTWNDNNEGFGANGYHAYGNIYQDLQNFTNEGGPSDGVAPSQPDLVSPANSASFNNQTLFSFVWKKSSDNIDADSDITYNIDVAADSGFANIEKSKSVTGLTNVDLVLTNGSKYWRVIAYDTSLNASTYETRSFTVNNTSTNGSLCIDYKISQNYGNYGAQKTYTVSQDWSSYSGIRFYVRGDGTTSGINYYVYLYEDNDGDNAYDDVWTYKITNVTGTNWQAITLPWGNFSDPSWDSDVDSAFDAKNIIQVSFLAEAPAGAPIEGKFWVDEFSRVGDSGVFFSWNHDDEGFVGNGYHGDGNVYQDLQIFTHDTGSGDAEPPSSPALVSPSDSAVFNNQTFFHFIWNHSTDNVGVASYKVEVSGDSSFNSIEASKGVSGTNADLVLTNGTKYWRVTAYDDSLNSAVSSSYSFTVNNTSTNGSLCIDYTISADYGNYGAQKSYTSAQDWSSYSGVKFYVRGDGTSGINYYIYLFEDNENADGVEDDVWTYKITNITGSGWQEIVLPWGSFSDPSWDKDIDSSFDAAKIIKVAFLAEAPAGTPISGKFWADEFSRVGDSGVLFTWNDGDEGFVGNGYNGSGNVYQDLQIFTNSGAGTSDTTPPSVPLLVLPSDNAKLTNRTTIHFVWNPSTDDTTAQSSIKYTVEVAADSSFSQIEKNPTVTGVTNTDIVLTNGLKYWRVKAMDSSLNTAVSASRSLELVQTSTNGSLQLDFTISDSYGNATAQKIFSSSQDWSSESGLRFYVKGSGQADLHYYVYLYEDNDSSGVYDDVWAYQFSLSDTNWVKVAVPWSSFSDPAWDEDIAADQSKPSASKVVKVAVVVEGVSAPISGTLYIDEFSVGGTKLFSWNKDDEGFSAVGYKGSGTIAQNLQIYVTNDVIDTTPPSAPYLLRPASDASVETVSINFIWTASSDNVGVNHYEIEISSNLGFTQIEYSGTAGGTNAIISGLTKGQKYWRVRAVDGDLNVGGWTADSFVNNYTPPAGDDNNTADTNQYSQYNTVSIYNTVVNLKDDSTDNDKIVFVGLSGEKGTIDIYDILGNLVETTEYTGSYLEWQFPETLPAGVYLANIKPDEGSAKIVKIVIVK